MKGDTMKNVRKVKKLEPDEDGMLAEYDFSKSVPSNHYKKYREGVSITIYSPNKETVKKHLNTRATLIVLEPDVAKVFKNAESVNRALRNIIDSFPIRSVRKRKAA
jgi:hypothetical protein